MHLEEHRGVQLDVCPSCPGVWFDWGELEAYHDNGGDSALTGLPGPSARFEPTGESTGTGCPFCHQDILRTGRVGSHRVIRCTTCGGLFLPLVPESDSHRGLLGAAIRSFREVVGALTGRREAAE